MSQPILALFVSFLTESVAPVAPQPGNDSGNGPSGPTDFLQAARAINFVLLEEASPVRPPPRCTLSPLPVCHTHWFYGLPSCLSHTLASRTAVPSVTHTGFTDSLASFVRVHWLSETMDCMSMRSWVFLLSLMF